MIAIALRTFFIYIFISLSMRISGKRQLGQLQIGELVTTLLLSELAAFPIADPNIPLAFALVPVSLIMLCEITFSTLCALSPNIKKFFAGTPSFLIANGKLNEKQLFKNRISPDELLAQLRLKNVSDLSQVDYAILEQNGQLSVVLKASKQPLTPSDMNITPQTEGLARPLIICGRFDRSNMQRLNISEELLRKRLGEVPISEVLLYTVNEGGQTRLILRDKRL